MIEKLYNKTEEELDFIILYSNKTLEDVNKCVDTIDKKAWSFLNISLIAVTSLINVYFFKDNFRTELLIPLFLLITGFCLSIILCYFAYKPRNNYYTSGQSTEVFISNINTDSFYENLHGQKVGLCINNDFKIKNNQKINNNKALYLKFAIFSIVISIIFSIIYLL